MSASRSKQAPAATVTDNDNTDNSVMQWQGSPLDKASWYFDGKRKLFDNVRGARNFITHGTVVDRGKVAVYSVRHAQALIHPSFVPGTITAPLKARELFYNKPAVAMVPAAGSTPPSGGSAAPAPAPVIPTSVSELGAAAERFVVAPELLDAKDDDILRHWTYAIKNTVIKSSVTESAYNSGVAFIYAREAEAAATSSDAVGMSASLAPSPTSSSSRPLIEAPTKSRAERQ